MNLKIDPHGLPDDGLFIEGSQPSSFFDLPATDLTQAVSKLEYALNVVKDESDLIVTGTLAATFEMECGRCTERYQHRLEINDYVQEIELENDAPVDLTTWLREDILLTLPTYPRCENGNVQPRECPAEGSFEDAPNSVIIEPHQAEDKAVWEALDQLKNLKRN